MTEPIQISNSLLLSQFRRQEYSRLDASGHIYLDYTGAGLYPESLIRQHIEVLKTGVFGNPHSSNPTSNATTDLVESARSAILSYFCASPDEYAVVFTLNASGALKLVGESYPFERGDRFLLTYDNHNSVNGIREFARAKGAGIEYVPITDPDLRIDSSALKDMLATRKDDGAHRLFAYPAQSNFSGVQHSLSWITEAQDLGWDVLLDGAAFVPTNRLDLGKVSPDFVAVSFYKMFGYPTGVGCLLARREPLAKLQRPWFAGGTVLLASAQVTPCEAAAGFAMQQGAAAFEDGTLNYLAIPAVTLGLRCIEDVGIENIHKHVASLTSILLTELRSLKHSNGTTLVHLYGPPDVCERGGTVAMNFFDVSGCAFDPREVERLAGNANISVRTGCHCNPGAGQTALHISDEHMSRVFKAKGQMSLDRFRLVADELREGAVRVSFGIASQPSDIDAFLRVAQCFLDRRVGGLGG